MHHLAYTARDVDCCAQVRHILEGVLTCITAILSALSSSQTFASHALCSFGRGVFGFASLDQRCSIAGELFISGFTALFARLLSFAVIGGTLLTDLTGRTAPSCRLAQRMQAGIFVGG